MHTILVIEDEQFLQSLIAKKLADHNYGVLAVRSIVQALEYLTSLPGITAIWLDHYLIGSENGLDFMRRLHDNPQWNNIPVFVISGSHDENNRDTYQQLGADGYFLKDQMTIDQIVEAISRQIGEGPAPIDY